MTESDIRQQARIAALEEAANLCTRVYAKTPFHFELGFACAEAIRELIGTGGRNYKQEYDALAHALVGNTGASAILTAERLTARVAELEALINTPTTDDWFEGVRLEAAHQQERWGADHDAGKGPLDWFWLIGYLAQKAATSAIAGDENKAKHHTISTAAALLNWHRKISGEMDAMRPGIAEPAWDQEARAALAGGAE